MRANDDHLIKHATASIRAGSWKLGLGFRFGFSIPLLGRAFDLDWIGGKKQEELPGKPCWDGRDVWWPDVAGQFNLFVFCIFLEFYGLFSFANASVIIKFSSPLLFFFCGQDNIPTLIGLLNGLSLRFSQAALLFSIYISLI